MRVLINPTNNETGSGLTSQVSWENPDTRAALESLFGVNKKTERLVQVEISKDGITARLEYVQGGK